MIKKEISVRQLALIAFMSIFALKLTILPSLLYQQIGVDSIWVIFLSLSVDFVGFLLIYFVLKRNKDISFYKFLCNNIGKFFAKVVMICVGIFFLFKLLLLAGGGYLYARQVIFQEAPLILFLFIFLIIGTSLFLFGMKSYGRTVEFFYPILATMLILFFAVALLTGELQDLRPFFENGIKEIGSTYFLYLMTGGDFLFMLFFMGKIKFGKEDNKTLFGHILFGIILLIIFYFLNASIFRYTAMIHPNAISEIVQFLPIPTILGNFDWLAVILMLMLFTFQAGLFMFCIGDSCLGVIHFENINERVARKWIILAINVLVIILTYFVFRTFVDLKVFCITYVNYLAIGVECLPILCFLIELAKNKRGDIDIIKSKETEVLDEKNN